MRIECIDSSMEIQDMPREIVDCILISSAQMLLQACSLSLG